MPDWGKLNPALILIGCTHGSNPIPNNLLKYVLIVSVILLSLAGAWLVRVNTPIGMGMYPDSVTYIMGARNIVEGNGFTQFSGTDVLKPITHYPPLYSYLLASIGLTGMDIIRATRLVNIVLMALCLLPVHRVDFI